MRARIANPRSNQEFEHRSLSQCLRFAHANPDFIPRVSLQIVSRPADHIIVVVELFTFALISSYLSGSM